VLPNSTCECDQPVVQAINGGYLLDGLKAGFNTCRVPSIPSPWRCTGSTDGLHVVMPWHTDAPERQGIIESVAASIVTHSEGEQTVDTPEVTPETNETSAQDQQTAGSAAQHKPNLTLVDHDPVQELIDAVTEAQEAVKQAGSALHGIKGKLKAVEKHYRSRQREFDSTRRIIENLKVAANF